jgi:hypothetical protein
MKQFDINTLDRLVAEGKLMMQTHPTLPLRIYKYTPELQFSKEWDELTVRCRGLVVDNDGFQYSNPIPKFHNIEELQADPSFQLPNLPYEITDKVDGSCIEVFWYGNRLIVCTLGSFESDQAKLASQMIFDSLMHLPFIFSNGKTYIFELVAPENSIVLDYGKEKKLVLLTVRDNDTDEELLPTDLGFECVEKINKTIEELILEKKREDFINKEGFVIRFSNGFRVKVKYEEYFRLHKIMTGVNEKFVWEFLRDGKPLPLVNVPDEFFQYVTGVKERLEKEYQDIEGGCKIAFASIYNPELTRKEFALQALKSPYASVLFKMLENKPYDQLIWKFIEPKITDRPKFNSFRGVPDEA